MHTKRSIDQLGKAMARAVQAVTRMSFSPSGLSPRLHEKKGPGQTRAFMQSPLIRLVKKKKNRVVVNVRLEAPAKASYRIKTKYIRLNKTAGNETKPQV